jgi:nucleotide-binding universal stress UspA family protein
MLRLLLPIDGSAHSLNAARYVARLARGGARIDLHVLHVEEPVAERTHAFLSQEQIKQLQQQDALKRCRHVLQYLRGEGLAFVWHVAAGDPAGEIARYAEDHSVDGIAMGTRGMNPLAKVLLGSVATQVVHEVDVPVTLVK